MLELLLLPLELLFELELELFLEPPELDLVGMILSFSPPCTTRKPHRLFLRLGSTFFVPLLFSANKSNTEAVSGGARPPLRERNDRLH